MISRFTFYLKHALRSLLREPRRSLFAAFAIAAGVAAIVGLQSLGLSIDDSVTRNIQGTNQGDIVVTADEDGFTSEERAGLDRMIADGRFVDSTYFYLAHPDRPSFIAADGRETAADLQWLQPYLVEPDKYPLYGEIRALKPKGASLEQLLSSPRAIVISEDIAVRLDVEVDDAVVLENTDVPFTVTGIVPNSTAGGVFAPYFVPPLPWFGYLDEADPVARQVLDSTEKEATVLFVQTATEAEASDLAQEIARISPSMEAETATGRLEEVQDATGVLERFLMVAGLVSLAIGGIGILNTMLVVVRRRTTEIGVLKALGLKGRQVTVLFMTEGLILGVLGSAFGIGLGIGLSYALIGFSEQFLQADVGWRIETEPVVTGAIVGVVATAVFGFLPTLAAGRVRPNAVIQPQEGAAVTTGRLLSFVVVLGLAGVMGVITGVFVENLFIGILIAYGAMAVIIVLTLLLLAVVSVVGRIPDFGRINLKLSLRGLSRQKARAASTLLALVVGLFAMGSIVIVGGSVTSFIDENVEDLIGGNIFMFLPPDQPELRDPAALAIASIEGVTNIVEAHEYRVQVEAVNGVPVRDLALGLASRDGVPSGGEPELIAGRTLGPEDKGQRRILARQDLGWDLHDTLTLGFAGSPFDFEIVGVMAGSAEAGFEESTFLAPLGVVPETVTPESITFLVSVPEDEASVIASRLNSEVPGAIAITTVAVASIFNEVFDRITILPKILSALALFTGAVIIANSVALATIERRREIAMMKAVGAKASRVLTSLLLENAILGLVGGAIGVGLSMGVLVLFNRLEPDVPVSPDPLSIVIVVAVAVGVALAAAMLSAWPVSRERPLNVLRYE